MCRVAKSKYRKTLNRSPIAPSPPSSLPPNLSPTLANSARLLPAQLRPPVRPIWLLLRLPAPRSRFRPSPRLLPRCPPPARKKEKKTKLASSRRPDVPPSPTAPSPPSASENLPARSAWSISPLLPPPKPSPSRSTSLLPQRSQFLFLFLFRRLPPFRFPSPRHPLPVRRPLSSRISCRSKLSNPPLLPPSPAPVRFRSPTLPYPNSRPG